MTEVLLDKEFGPPLVMYAGQKVTVLRSGEVVVMDAPIRVATSFQDIPQLTQWGSYAVDVDWRYLESHIARQTEWGLDLDPDFQRAHVWTEEQQIAFVEFKLRGGHSGGDILTNCKGWHDNGIGDYVLVDGKQRLNAVRRFLSNELPAFGRLFKDYTGTLRFMQSFRWHVNDLPTRADVLRWYLELNAGGTPHTAEEIERVRQLLIREGGE